MTFTISCWSEDRPACCCGHVHIQAGTADSEPSKFPMNKHKCFMPPSPEHLARLGGWEREGNRIMLLLGSVFPAPLPVCCGKPLAAKQRITCGPSRAIQQKLKRLFPRTSQALEPLCLVALFTGARTLWQQRKPCANMAPEKTCQKKKKSIFVLLFFPMLAVIILFNFFFVCAFFKNTSRYNISWRSFTYLLKECTL